MKYMMIVDVEGITGITNYEQAIDPEFATDMTMRDVNAVLDGIFSVSGNEVLIYDEHTNGCNLRLTELPAEVNLICGKPLVQGKWHGVDSSFDGVILLGFHARAGTKGALLAHSYYHWNKNIWINGFEVGEIGMEAALAGDNGVPIVLVTGDSDGIEEAKSLLPGISTVVVKEGLGEFQAKCYPNKKTYLMLKDSGMNIGKKLPQVKPLTIQNPVELKIELAECEYREHLKRLCPEWFISDSNVLLQGETVTHVWTKYLTFERRITNEFKL